MNKPTKVSEDARKARLVSRLMNIAKRHGVYITFFDDSDELVQGIRDMHTGRLLREALADKGDGEIDFIGADEPAGPPDVWPTPEHAVMFARYVQARRAKEARP